MPQHGSIPSRVAIAGHPLHPMLVVFPIAFLVSLPLADLMFWWRADPFWARLGFWLAAAGLAGGLLAAAAGFLEFLLVRRARERLAGWSHMLAAVMAMSLAGANVMLRIDAPAAAVLPWGLVLSVLTAGMIGMAGWIGGTLTFGHGIGTYHHPHDSPAREGH